MKRLLTLCLLGTLTACTPSVPQPVVFVAACPEVPTYTKEFDTEIADYLAQLPPSAVFDAYLSGAEKLRAEASACIATRKQWEQKHPNVSKH